MKDYQNKVRGDIRVILFCLGILIANFNVFAISSGDRVEANGTVNVRSTPAGTAIGQQTLGSLGVIIGGPTTAILSGIQYTWWDVNFDSGVDGWVADVGLTSVDPAAPAQNSPGSTSSPGPTISTLTPTMSWNAATGANGYGVYVEDVATSTLVYNVDSVGNVTSVALPSGTLLAGHSYVWNMRSSDSAGFTYCTTHYYFQTQASQPPTHGIASQIRADTGVAMSDPPPGTLPYGVGIYFRVTPTDPQGNTVRMEIEWHQLPATFTGTANLVSSYISSGSQATTPTLTGLAVGNYGWAYRVVDSQGLASAWVPANNPDFIVQAPPPSISSLSPASMPALSANQSLVIYGNNFQSEATLTFVPPEGGTIASTASKLTVNSSTQITYQINNLSDVGTWSVQVNNPDSQSSGTVSFTVTNSIAPPPSISSLSPTLMPALSANQPLVIHGNNFQNAATLTFVPPEGGTIASTASKLTVNSGTQITYQINNLSDVGTWTVQVNNPDSQSSGTASFTVTNASTTVTSGRGIDFNANTGNINWQQETSSAPSFLIIKATQGDNPNSFLPSDMSSVPAVTSVFSFGVFDFADPDEYANPSTEVSNPGDAATVIADAQAAANSFYQIAKPYLTAGHLLPALDVEDEEGDGGFNSPYASLSGYPQWSWSEMAEWIAAWTKQLQLVDPTLPAPILYMTQGYAENISPQLINSYLSTPVSYQLWIVDDNEDPNVDPSPSIGSWNAWAIEQYHLSATLPGDLDALNPSTTLTSLEIPGGNGEDGSAPAISNPSFNGSTFTLSVPTQAGTNYVLEFKNFLSDAVWTPIQTNSGIGGMMSLTNSGISSPSRFYRIRIQ